VQSPSSEAKLFSPSDRVPEFYRTRTFITVYFPDQNKIRGTYTKIVHYCVHKISPLVPNLNQINLIHVLPFYFFKLHLNILLSKPSLPSGLLSSGFPTNSLYALFLSHAWYTAHPSHSRNTNYEGCHYSVFLNFLSFLPFRSKYFPYHPAFEPPHSMFFFPCEKSCSPMYFNIYIFRHKRKDQRLWTEL
jgi:hypothetical protein